MDNVQIFLFPFAGGNAHSFSEIIKRLPRNFETIAIEYPGHGARSKEPFLDDFESLLNDVAIQINSTFDKNKKIVFFGYSLGSLIAFEIIARHMIHIDVSCFFACAQESPTINSFNQRAIDWTDENVLKYTICLGGIDQRLIDNPRFLKALLLPTKHDYLVRESYIYHNGVITCPVHVLYSDEDTPYLTVEKWHECCKKEVILHDFKGNHFFINNNTDEIAEIVTNVIKTLDVKRRELYE